MFWGTAATHRWLAGYDRGGPFQSDVLGDITRHVGWTRHNTDNIFRQDSKTDHGCVENPGDTDLASTSGFGNDRYHLRMWDLRGNRYSNQNFYASTTPHKEHWVWGDGQNNDNDCGTGPGTGSHAVDATTSSQASGFDLARRRMRQAYLGHSRHPVEDDYFGNTQQVKQCDGQFAGSNGNGVLIRVERGATAP